jgi:uncharacterized protein involved in exopolysaccharide biosynthesis
MSIDNDQSLLSGARAIKLRFSLLALLVFVTIVCLFLAWEVQPRKYVLTSLFQVSAVRPSIFGNAESAFNEREFDLLRRTQLELIKSDFVLQAALRDPKVAALPIIQSQIDPISWLRNHLEIDSPGGSEVLAIRMHCPKEAVDDYRAILDSVASAYQKEVVFSEAQRRLVNRDALVKTLSRISDEVEARMRDLQTVSKDSEKDSPAVRMGQARLDGLMEVMHRAGIALQDIDMEAGAPQRIRLIQPATAAKE